MATRTDDSPSLSQGVHWIGGILKGIEAGHHIKASGTERQVLHIAHVELTVGKLMASDLDQLRRRVQSNDVRVTFSGQATGYACATANIEKIHSGRQLDLIENGFKQRTIPLFLLRPVAGTLAPESCLGSSGTWSLCRCHKPLLLS